MSFDLCDKSFDVRTWPLFCIFNDMFYEQEYLMSTSSTIGGGCLVVGPQ